MRKEDFRNDERCGLTLQRSSAQTVRTSPAGFAALFPGSNGAIYGRASHGWMASFRRQSARCMIPGLYFAGGSVHPGPGVPMAAMSGRLAAEALLKDFASQKAVPPGGYAWWYLDAFSNDGRHGLTVIAFIGSVFSPFYFRARRANPAAPPDSTPR